MFTMFFNLFFFSFNLCLREKQKFISNLVIPQTSKPHSDATKKPYNAKLRSGEVLVRSNGDIELIRRPETEKDYFATLDFPGSKYGFLAK